MKAYCPKVLFFLVILFVFRVPAYAQWTPINTNLNFTINDIDFYTLGEGMLAARQGLYLTQDSGYTWTRVTDYDTANDSLVYNRSHFSAVYHYSNGVYYGGGRDTSNNQAVIFRYETYSSTLELVTSDPTSTGVNAIDYGVAVGNNGFIGKITYSGFSKSNLSITSDLYDVAPKYNSSSSSYRYVVGNNVLISYSTVYSSTVNSLNESFKGIALINSSSQRHIGIYDSIVKYHRSNHGYQINNNYDGAPLHINKIEHLPTSSYGNEAYLCTESGIYRSYNNGTAWEHFPGTDMYQVNCLDAEFYYNSSYTAYAGCKNGVILRATNSGGTSMPYANFQADGGVCLGQQSSFDNLGNPANTHTWLLNNTQVGTAYDYTHTFNSLGSFTLSLISSNGSYSDTIHHTIQVTDYPSSAIPMALSDSLICKEGSTDIFVNQPENNIRYTLYEYPSMNYVASQLSNGASLTLNTGFITDSTDYLVEAENPLSGCALYLDDTLTAGVENTLAKFHISHINRDTDEDIRYFNLSEYCDTAHWHFDTGASSAFSFSDSSVDISYMYSGVKQGMLVAKSNSGCKDTLQLQPVNIYAADSNYNRQWATEMYAQDFTWQGYSVNFGPRIESDDDGNSYFAGTTNNGYCNTELGLPGPTTATGFEFYLSKYDDGGVLQWQIGSYQSSKEVYALDMELFNNHLYVVVSNSSSNTDQSTILSNDGKVFEIDSVDSYIIKVDLDGVIKWIRPTKKVLTRICISPNGDIYGIGQGYYHHYVTRLDSMGHELWYNAVNSSYYTYYFSITDIGCDKHGNAYVVGTHGGHELFLPSTNGHTDTIVKWGSGTNPYLVKYDSAGVVQWAFESLKNTRFDGIHTIAVDSLGDFYVSGYIDDWPYTETAAFNSANGAADTLEISEYFLSKYTASGIMEWTVGRKDKPTGSAPVVNNIEIKDSSLFVAGSGFISVGDSLSSTDSTWMTWSGAKGKLFFGEYSTDGVLKWITTESGSEGKNTAYATIDMKDLKVNAKRELLFSGNYRMSNVQPFYLCNDTVNADLSVPNTFGYIGKMDSDHMTIDDLSFESDTAYCQGQTIQIPYEAFGEYSLFSDNVFEVQLSDPYGMFLNPLSIGTLTSTQHIDTLTALVPTNLQPSSAYRIRVVSSNQALVSDPHIFQLGYTPVASILDTSLCYGGQMTLQASGGDSFNWTPGSLFADSTLQNVQYTAMNDQLIWVEVQGPCGNVTDTFDIQVGQGISHILPADTTVCAGSSVSLSTLPEYTYSWYPSNYYQMVNDSVSLLVPMTSIDYQVTTLDSVSNCYRIDTLKVEALPLPSAQMSNYVYSICSKDTLTLHSSTSHSLQWLSNYLINATNVYAPVVYPEVDTFYVAHLIHNQNGCENFDTVYIDTKPLPDVDIQYNGVDMSVAAGEPIYQWFRNDSILYGAATHTLVPDVLAPYTVYVMAANGCDALSDPFIYTSLADPSAKVGLLMYPNPTHDKLFLNYTASTDEKLNIYLYDMGGKQVAILADQQAVQQGDNTLYWDIRALGIKPSNYLLRIHSSTQCINKVLTVK